MPPDTSGAAGPSAYVETVNQSVALYTSKATGAGAVTDSLSHFLFTTGGLTRADSGSGLSDPVVTYDEQIGRFIVGDQDVNFNTHVSAFDLAVSKTNNPTTLSAADWTFYKITTTRVRVRRRLSRQLRLQPRRLRLHAEHVRRRRAAGTCRSSRSTRPTW